MARLTVQEYNQGLKFMEAAADHLRLARHHLSGSTFDTDRVDTVIHVLVTTIRVLETGRDAVATAAVRPAP